MFSFGVDSSQTAKKALSSSASARATMDEEEVQKRNTDCIYFLASPLTCKKGSNCDYRHSEVARMNPRDCRFWLSGNCLNARCSFRHPPVEGRPVSSTTAPIPPQAAGTVSMSNKHKMTCYFFAQGYCAKNDKCPFMHASVASTMETAPQQKSAIEPVGKEEAANSQAGVSSQRASPIIEGHLIAQPTPFKGQLNALPFEGVSEKPNDAARVKVSGSFSNSAPFKQWPMVQNAVALNSRQTQFLKKEMKHPVKEQGELQSQFVKKMEHPMKEQGEVQRLVHTQILPNQNGDGRESLGGLDKRRQHVYSSHSDSQESSKQFDNSSRSNGTGALDSHGGTRSGSSEQEVDGRGHHASSVKSFNGRTGAKRDSNGEDLRDQLVKRRKSIAGNPSRGGQPGTHVGGLHSHRQQDVKDRDMYRRSSSQPDSKGVKKVMGSSFSGAGNGILRSSQLKSSPHKQTEKDQPGTALKASQREQHISEKLPSTSTSVRTNNGTSAFTGPKSLAQIKAEKLARAAPINKTGQAGPRPVDRKPAGISNSSAIVDGVFLKAEGVTMSEDFAGPKPLSCLLKEKRKLETDGSYAQETTQVPRSKMELPMTVKSSEELEEGEVAADEEGEVAEDDDEFKSKGLDEISSSCAVPAQEKPLTSFQYLDAQVSEGRQRRSVEAAAGDLEMSEEGLLEMEDDAYDGEDLEMMEEYDDDDDDGTEFAKKLGSFFAMSS